MNVRGKTLERIIWIKGWGGFCKYPILVRIPTFTKYPKYIKMHKMVGTPVFNKDSITPVTAEKPNFVSPIERRYLKNESNIS